MLLLGWNKANCILHYILSHLFKNTIKSFTCILLYDIHKFCIFLYVSISFILSSCMLSQVNNMSCTSISLQWLVDPCSSINESYLIFVMRDRFIHSSPGFLVLCEIKECVVTLEQLMLVSRVQQIAVSRLISYKDNVQK